MIISFSGLDGAGKTTQINLLLDYYRTQGASVGSIYSYYPDLRYHSIRELHMIYNKLSSYDVIHIRYRLNSDNNCVIMKVLESKKPPQLIMATAAAVRGYLDHKELNKHVLEPLVDNNKILIFDRYYYDELAFKYVYGCPAFVLNRMYQKERDADLAFLVKVSLDECIKRNQFRPDSTVSLYQSQKNIALLADRFDYIAKKKKLITLDGTLPRKEISKMILNLISTY